MTVPTVNVTLTVCDITGAAVPNATVTAQLTGLDLYNAVYVLPNIQTFITDVNGLVTMPLFPNALGQKNTRYQIKGVHPTTGQTLLNVTVFVPNFNCDVSAIAGNSPASQPYPLPSVQPYSSILTRIAGGVQTFSAALISFIQLGVGAVLRTVSAKLQDSISINDFGADPSATAAVNTAAIQAAIEQASTLGRKITGRAGTYLITPATATTDENGSLLAAFIMRSNMHFDVDPGCVFKISDNVSTDANVVLMAMFHTNGVLSNLSWRNLMMDMNGAHNKISPSRGTLTYNRYNQAHISVSGTPAGIAARADDVDIDHCQLINTAGVSCIVAGQSNTAGITLGKRWRVRYSKFWNNGLDADDHTSLYAWVDDVLTEGNEFGADAMWSNATKTGPVCAYEMHGANQRFVDNNINNYYQGMWVGWNKTSAVERGVVKGNTMRVAATGIDFGRESANDQPVRDIDLEGNIIELTLDAIPIGIRSGYSFESIYAITDISIRGGRVFIAAGDTVGSTALYMNPSTTAAQKHSRITMQGVKTRGLNMGGFLKTNGTNGLGVITIGPGNEFMNCAATVGFPSAAGITYVSATGTIDQLNIPPNVFADDSGGAGYHYGLLLQLGTITNYNKGTQSYRGIATADELENAITITKRRGFCSGSYTPALTNRTNVAASTSAGAQWVLVDKVCTVSGKCTIDPTAAGLTQLGISLPPGIASNFGAEQDCSGVAFSEFVAYEGASVYADAANDRANLEFIAVDTTNKAYRYTFTFRVLA